MFVKYDAAAAEAASNFVPAFQAGQYPARATGFAMEMTKGGNAIVVTFEVWQQRSRGAPRRSVKCHFCLEHPNAQARGMFHARLKDLGVYTSAYDGRMGGTNVAGVIGKWVMV